MVKSTGPDKWKMVLVKCKEKEEEEAENENSDSPNEVVPRNISRNEIGSSSLIDLEKLKEFLN